MPPPLPRFCSALTAGMCRSVSSLACNRSQWHMMSPIPWGSRHAHKVSNSFWKDRYTLERLGFGGWGEAMVKKKKKNPLDMKTKNWNNYIRGAYVTSAPPSWDQFCEVPSTLPGLPLRVKIVSLFITTESLTPNTVPSTNRWSRNIREFTYSRCSINFVPFFTFLISSTSRA